jgi:hypothetical protein
MNKIEPEQSIDIEADVNNEQKIECRECGAPIEPRYVRMRQLRLCKECFSEISAFSFERIRSGWAPCGRRLASLAGATLYVKVSM